MVTVGLVGCGGIHEVHCRQLSKMEGVIIAGHCDTDQSRAEAAAARFGGAPFTEYEAMYEAVKPHAVYVNVPPYAHGAMEERAAERGIHLFIEKPVALDRKTAKRVGAALRKAQVLCSVGYCMRYADTVARARQYLKGKAICQVVGFYNGGLPDVWWWRRQDKSGGQLIEQSTHVVDLIRYLCGEISEVYAVGASGCMTHVKDYDIHDSSAVALRMKNGASGALVSSCVSECGGSVGVNIITPEATVRLCDGTLTIVDRDKETTYKPFTDMYADENLAFIDAVRTQRRSRIRSPYSDAVKTLLVSCAANDSIASGLPVKT